MPQRQWFFIAILSFLFSSLMISQGCSQPVFLSDASEKISSVKASSNGGVYDGKIRIFHRYEDGFNCEGRPQPKEILVREEGGWYLTQNTNSKCAQIDHQSVTGIIYNEGDAYAIYMGKVYVLPRTYFVDATENPNLPDIDLLDGVCEDQNFRCSLRASIDQSSLVSLTGPTIVRVPAGQYLLTSKLEVHSYVDSYLMTIKGLDPLNTIISGNNTTSIMLIEFDNGAKASISIENLTFTNGNGNSFTGTADASAALTVGRIGQQKWHPQTHLQITNCIFKNNKGDAAIFADPGTGNISVLKSQLINNLAAGIQVFGVSSLFVEDTIISGNMTAGIWAYSSTSNVTIRKSSIFNNDGYGVSLYECSFCSIENSTVFANNKAGIDAKVFRKTSDFDLTIKNSTIYNNALVSGSNLETSGFGGSLNLILNNSIIAIHNNLKKNCTFSDFTPQVLATNNLFDDASCNPTGTGNILADPLLNSLQNNGGSTPTLAPSATSPIIDAGANAVCSSVDQRGLARPVDKRGTGLKCDIGSVEVQ